MDRDLTYLNIEDRRAYQRKWNSLLANKEKRKTVNRVQRLRRKGLTINSYEEKWLAQGKVCDICKSDDPHTKRGWHVDHDHKTGKLRSILCSHCNVMLGTAFDSVDRLQAGIEYLKRYSNEQP